MATVFPTANVPEEPSHSAGRHLGFYRLICYVGGVVIIGFGVLYRLTDPTAVDPYWSRFLIAALPILLALLSKRSRWVRMHFVALYRLLIYVVMVWFVTLAAINDFSSNYALGTLLAVAVLMVTYSVGVRHLKGLITFSVATAGVVLASFLLSPGPQISAPIFFFCILSMPILLCLAVAERLRAEADLAESEERNRAILMQTSDGVFLADLETLRFIDSNPAFRQMLGYSESELQSRAVTDLTPEPEELKKKLAELGREKDGYLILEHPLLRAGGEVLPAELHANIITYGGMERLCITAHDIQERKEAEEALRAAKERAEEMLQAKSALFNNLSHEIRTPLTGIIGFAEVLAEEEKEPGLREFAENIVESARRLQQTLNSVLDMARLEGDGVTPRPQEVDLAEETRQTAAFFRSVAQRKGVALELEVSPSPLMAQTDPAFFNRVLTNLLSNAVKFTREGTVAVQLGTRAGTVVLQVSDTGIGISEKFMPELFEEFKQESTGLTRSHEGVGIGLAITKHLVERMDGEVRVESERGEGSTFTVHFPHRKPATLEETA